VDFTFFNSPKHLILCVLLPSIRIREGVGRVSTLNYRWILPILTKFDRDFVPGTMVLYFCLILFRFKIMKSKKTLLMILDGWGIGDGSKADVISQVPTPNLTYYKNISQFKASCIGEDVGLPEGQMGNSEVGHLNIGAEELYIRIWLR